MKKIQKRVINILLVLGLGGVIGFILLLLVYLLPVTRIIYNANASVEQFREWGWNPRIIEDYESTTIDTYTDAWMMRIAFYDGDESILQKCMGNYYYGYDDERTTNVCESMISYLEGMEGYKRFSYGRYWHGYLILLKPLMCFFSYEDIIGILKCIQLALAASCIVLFVRKKLTRCIPCMVVMLSCIEFHVIGMSMQFSWVFMVAMLSSIYLLNKKEEAYFDPSVDLAFLVTGMCTSYMDFLTYPLFTLGVPLTVILVQRSMQEQKARLFFTTLLDSLYWAIGYGGMWLIKWILCTVVTGENIIADGIYTVMYRTGSDVLGEKVGYLEVLEKNIWPMGKYPYALAVVCAAVFLLGRGKTRFVRISKGTVAAYIFVACLPLLWYAVVKQHSYIHDFMTYRNLGISVFAVLCFLSQIKTPLDNTYQS